ncbi:dipeptidase, partial [Bacillus sp. AFS076308]
MDFSLKHLAASTLILASLSSFTVAAQTNITPQQSATILKNFSDVSATDFRQFLAGVAKSNLAKTADLGPAISAFQDNKTLTPE